MVISWVRFKVNSQTAPFKYDLLRQKPFTTMLPSNPFNSYVAGENIKIIISMIYKLTYASWLD